MASSSAPNSSEQQGQQQSQYAPDYDRQNEYTLAQRAAVEAVTVGRETLQQSVQQDEQLNRALGMAEETEYKLDKAGRILRGMTWSGWVANMFTKPVGPLPEGCAAGREETGKPVVPVVYEQVIPECQEMAQALQNYNANVTVLEACETEEQKATLKLICDSMYDSSCKSLNELKKTHPQLDAYYLQFERDLLLLRNRQKRSEEITRQLGSIISLTSSAQIDTTTGGTADKNRAELFSSTTSSTGTTPKSDQDKINKFKEKAPPIQQREQDEHLAVMAQTLGELGSIAKNLHHSIGQQSHTISNLDERTDLITEKSRAVTRRANRLVQKRSWKPVKPTFHCHVAIRHIATGRYLAALDNSNLLLVPRFHHETCVFGLWKRQGDIFGLQNKHSGRWAGQSVFGSLACSAYSFGRREEWEAAPSVDDSNKNGNNINNDDWSSTRLLICSAGWGAGGYLEVRPKDFAVLIGGCTVEERNKADLWAILPQDQIVSSGP